jgi:DNA primase
MSVIEEIKSRLDIVQYIQQYVPIRRQGRYYKAPCPFHSEKTPSFVVYEDRQSWRCFGACAEGGDIFRFAMKYHGWSFREALEELGKRAGVEVRQQTAEQRQQLERLDHLRAAVRAAAELYHATLLDETRADSAAVRAYARSRRGLTDETIARFQIGYAPDDWHFLHHQFTHLGYSEDDLLAVGLLKRNDKGAVYDAFRNRFMIPIRDERGRPIGFGARALAAEDNPKYLNSPQTPLFDKSRTLFALDGAKEAIRSSGTAVIVEGYMDAISAHQAGYSNVVAQMGTALTEAQLRLLVPKLASRVVMALDSDAAGQNATRRSLEVARQVLRADFAGRLSADLRVLRNPGTKDPDDLIREDPAAWTALVDGAIPVAEFVIEMELAGLPANPSVQEREAAARRLLPLLIATEDGLYKDANVQLLARRLRFDEQRVLGWSAEVTAIEAASARQKPLREAPKPPPGSASEPPDVPDDIPELSAGSMDEPPDMPDYIPEPPPDEEGFDDFDLPPVVPAAAQPVHAAVPDVPTERFCLKVLFTYPHMLYDVNRRLRELAGDETELTEWVLAELSPDDFTRDTYRALMNLFMEAMSQDERPPIDYMNVALPDALYDEAERIMRDEWTALRPLLRFGLTADLNDWLAKRGEGDADGLRAAFLEHALRLRGARLARERTEMSFIKPEDGFDETEVASYIKRSLRAKQLIDAELSSRLRGIRR